MIDKDRYFDLGDYFDMTSGRNNFTMKQLLPPVASFTYSGVLYSGNIISFTDISTNYPNTWGWDFDDTNTSTNQNPTHIFTPGVYDVGLTASNSVGSDYATNQLTIIQGEGAVNIKVGEMKTGIFSLIVTPHVMEFGGWFRIRQFSDTFLMGRTNTSGTSWYFRMYSDGSFGVASWNGPGYVEVKTTTTYSTDVWYHISAISTGSQMELYINNQYALPSNLNHSPNMAFGHIISIGGNNSGVVGLTYGDFDADECYVNDGSLDTSERTYYYNSGVGRSHSDYIYGSSKNMSYWWGFNNISDLGNDTGDDSPDKDLTLSGSVVSIYGKIRTD